MSRAVLREPDLPRASLPGAGHEVRLLVDYRDDLVGERARIQKRLRWNCHDLEPALDLPPRVLDRYVWLDRLESLLAALLDTTRKRIALEGVRRCRDLTTGIRALDLEIREYMRVLAPELMEIPGCSAISAANLIGQTAGASRFRDEAAFAMYAGVAPLPVSSGKSERYRLNRTGNRKPTSVIHVIAVTQARMHPPAIAFIERKRTEGMSNREVLRCLKRHIGRVLYKTMVRAEKARVASVVRSDFPRALSLSRCRIDIGATAESVAQCGSISGGKVVEGGASAHARSVSRSVASATRSLMGDESGSPGQAR